MEETARDKLKSIAGEEYNKILKKVQDDMSKEESMWFVLVDDIDMYLQGKGRLNLPSVSKYLARYTPDHDHRFWQKIISESQKE